VAKINPVKVRQDAEKAERSGRVDQAIVCYQQLVEDNPRDWNTWKKIGDLNQRLNKTREAIDAYARVADFLAGDGFHVKAIAMWKMINKLDPAAFDPYLKLADLYAKQGLMMEAKGQYQYVVDEHLRRGKVRDAGDVLKKMAEIDPSDLKVRSKLADLYLREGNTPKAVDEHIAIAAELNKKGHLAEALQVLEKGLKIDPKNRRIRVDVAGIHLLQKSFDKAIHHLEDAVQHEPGDTVTLARLGEAYLGGKRLEEAEGIFKRLLELDPENEENLISLGRVFLRLGDLDRAFDQYKRVADRLLERKEGEKAASLLQQILQASPAHVNTLLKLVEVFKTLRKDSFVAQTYSQLTEAYGKAGQIDQAIGILDLLVELEPHNAQHREKLGFYKRRRDEARGAPPSAPRPPAPGEGPFEIDFPAPPVPAGPRVSVPSAAPAIQQAVSPPLEIELSGQLSDDDKEFIEEHLGEGKVFRKYGLVDKAAEQFDSIVARFPDNVEARQELRDIFKEKGQAARAAEQCLALAQVFRLRGDAASAEAQETEARSLGAVPEARPSSPAAAPRAAVPATPPPEPPAIGVEEEDEVFAFGEPPPPTAGETEPPGGAEIDLGLPEGIGLGDGFLGDEELDLTPGVAEETAAEAPSPAIESEEEISFEDGFEEPELLVPPAPPPVPRVAEAPALPPDLAKMLAIVDDHMSLGFVDDAAEMLRKAETRHPGHPAISAKRRELGMEEAPLPSEEPLGALGLESPEEEAFAAELGLEPPVAAGSPFDGLDLPTPGAMEEVAAPATIPEEPGLDLGLGDLGLEEPSLPAPEVELPLPAEAEEPSAFGEELDLGALGAAEPEPEPAFAGGPFDAAGGLADEGESPFGGLFSSTVAVEEPVAEEPAGILGDVGLAEIFKEFKKGVDKQLGKEDYDTRYNLGIAYKEMGLVDEAIAEFQLAAKDESRLLECSSMLGICFMEKGMPALAVKWFEKGLGAVGRREEEYQGLRYDLAAAYEASGHKGRALGLYREIHSHDASFRDVADKVRQLAASSSV
jgi:pilus assembly protein FimV